MDTTVLLGLLKPMVEEAVAEALNKVLPKTITTPAETEAQAYKDFYTQAERESWVPDAMGFRYCLHCQKWEGHGHAPTCLFHRWTREGKQHD